jgi:hypothetical protein
MDDDIRNLLAFHDCIYGNILREVQWKGQRVVMPFMIFEEQGVDPCEEATVAYPKGSDTKVTLPYFAIWVTDYLFGLHLMETVANEEIRDYELGLIWLETHFPCVIEKLWLAGKK